MINVILGWPSLNFRLYSRLCWSYGLVKSWKVKCLDKPDGKLKCFIQKSGCFSLFTAEFFITFLRESQKAKTKFNSKARSGTRKKKIQVNHKRRVSLGWLHALWSEEVRTGAIVHSCDGKKRSHTVSISGRSFKPNVCKQTILKKWWMLARVSPKCFHVVISC